MAIWELIILFFSCFLGGMTVFLTGAKDKSGQLKLILSFSGAYLFGITVLHLIPDVYSSHSHGIGLYVLAGFIFQILLEQFSEGVEHGHIHNHGHEHYVFPLGVLISLCLHAFLEGMPLAEGHHDVLLWGIALHHIPAAFALTSLLVQSRASRKKIIMLLVVFSVMSPLGYLLSHFLSVGEVGSIAKYFDRIMAIVIGIFLHISTTILFESGEDHHFNRKKTLAVLTGMAIAVASLLAH